MINRKIKLSLIITLSYWLPSCYALFDVITNTGDFSSTILGTFLIPGYFLGFVLGFVGGDFAAVIGQLITLFILYSIIKVIVGRRNIEKKE